MRRSGGGGGSMDPIGKSHIWVDLDLNSLPPLTKFPGSAQAGGGGGAIYFTGMHLNRSPNGGPGSGGRGW